MKSKHLSEELKWCDLALVSISELNELSRQGVQRTPLFFCLPSSKSSMPMKASRISLTFSISVAVLSSSISIEALLPNRTKKNCISQPNWM